DQRLLNEPVYVLFTLFFILFGLAIFSACINLLILECMAYNADMVTARTRLKRMLSARISTSFRIVTGAGASVPSAPRLQPAGGAVVSQRMSRARGLMQRACAKRRRKCDYNNNGTFANGPPPPQPAAAGGGRKLGVVVEKINAERKCRSDSRRRDRRRYRRHSRARRRAASLSRLRDSYRNYCWTHPTHFTVRRLPTPYIEHLVNTGVTMANGGRMLGEQNKITFQ
uniref:Ion_trans domain-containing protein n=1 Tax=Globodera pallida TaxID=36090 RepID=A0A183CK67_GLOPA